MASEMTTAEMVARFRTAAADGRLEKLPELAEVLTIAAARLEALDKDNTAATARAEKAENGQTLWRLAAAALWIEAGLSRAAIDLGTLVPGEDEDDYTDFNDEYTEAKRSANAAHGRAKLHDAADAHDAARKEEGL